MITVQNMMKGSNTYAERFSVTTGETLFEEWCAEKGYQYIRLGFDTVAIPNFYQLNPFVRNLPDYLVVTDNGSRLVQVKGTFNFKEQEYRMLPEFISLYSSPDVPLYYAFCITDKYPLLLSAEELIGVYESSGSDRQWSDGKVYRNLNLTAEWRVEE
jgi:hypothetical protein